MDLPPKFSIVPPVVTYLAAKTFADVYPLFVPESTYSAIYTKLMEPTLTYGKTTPPYRKSRTTPRSHQKNLGIQILILTVRCL